jgi:hypothetical protein
MRSEVSKRLRLGIPFSLAGVGQKGLALVPGLFESLEWLCHQARYRRMP